jgi:N-acetylneuraminic acid mutarotase
VPYYAHLQRRWVSSKSVLSLTKDSIHPNVEIFVFGGEYDHRNHANVESYDPVNNQWQSWAPMPTARHGCGAAVIGNSIYVISGGPQPGTAFSSVNEVLTP